MKFVRFTLIALLHLYATSFIYAQEWELLLETDGQKALRAISFPDSLHGWMVGQLFDGNDLSYILYTKDGGETWQEQISAFPSRLIDVHFKDSLNGFIIGGNELQHTTDGGKNWIETDLTGIAEGKRFFVCLEFVDSVAWILGEEGRLLKSTDEGYTWEDQDPLPSSIYYTSIDFINQDTGVVVGGGSRQENILQTFDGGVSWEERKTDLEYGDMLLDVFYADDTTVFATGRGGNVVRSQDAGYTWNGVAQLISPGLRYLYNASLYFEDAMTGWVASMRPPENNRLFIHRTEDGGESWTEEINSNLGNEKQVVYDMVFDESGTGWVSGSFSTLYTNLGAFILRRMTVELPNAVCKDITAYLDETGFVTIYPEDIDNGSSDNSGIIDTMWVEQEQLRCIHIESERTVTLYVADPAGNISTCESKVFVKDTITPVAICKDISIQLDSTGKARINARDIGEDSYDNCYIIFSAEPDSFTIDDIGELAVTMTVEDESGNADSCTAIVTVKAHTPPASVWPDGLKSNGTVLLTVQPNPFDHYTAIQVEVKQKSPVVLDIYNATGQLEERIYNGDLLPGEHRFSFTPENEDGIYICVLRCGSEIQAKIMLTSR